MWIPPKQTLTYQEWRKIYNPWNDGDYINFKGDLDPVQDVNIIDGIHSLIDAYCDPRRIGVASADRFNILFHLKLQETENRFFNMLNLEGVYYNRDEMKYTSIENGTNTGKTVDDGSSNSDTTTANNSETTGENTVDGDTTNNTTDKTTATNDTRNRNLYSDTPQGNINAGDWLDGSYNWKYATSFDETRNNDTSETDHTGTGTTKSMTISNTSNKVTGDTSAHTLTTTNNNSNSENTHEIKRIDDVGNKAMTLKKYLLSQYSAWAWLIEQLETLFICTYDEGDF